MDGTVLDGGCVWTELSCVEGLVDGAVLGGVNSRGRSCPGWREWPWTELSWLEGMAVDGTVPNG